MKPFFLAVLCLLSSSGCSSGSEGEETPSVGRGSVSPPANIDITTCRSITEDSTEASTLCPSCCSPAGFTASSFINDGHCTCGRPRADGRDTVCSAPELAYTPDTC